MDEPLAIVLAAGLGKRMKSELPKVLIPVLGRPMIEYVLDALTAADIKRVIAIVGHRADDVKQLLVGRSGIEFALQSERKGTGHAAKMAQPLLASHSGPVVIVTGDSPLLQTSSLQKLLDHFNVNKPACLLGTLHKPNPQGLGRILRDVDRNFLGIVEERDATAGQKLITEVNMSTYVFAGPELMHALDLLKSDNDQGEYYLTDCPGILRSQGKLVEALPILQLCESLSINTPEELKQVEAEMRRLGYDRTSPT
jgi:bifunctional UDP-N-acetylglucosamine pyrophosphorylase/glucosamine-1-phosphate N-acetyltransferase